VIVKKAHPEFHIKMIAVMILNVFQKNVVIIINVCLVRRENLANVIIIVKLAIAAFLGGYLGHFIDALKIK
jgi:hypothetical protein